MELYIKKYLKDNNISGKNGIDYTLVDNGSGPKIGEWNLGIAAPEFTIENIALEKLLAEKERKIIEIKKDRDESLLRPTPYTIDIYSNSRLANLSLSINMSHIGIIRSIIDKIRREQNEGRSNVYRYWTDDSDNRVKLFLRDYENILSHLLFRDEQVHNIYNAKKKIINAAITIEQINNCDDAYSITEEKEAKELFLKHKKSILFNSAINISILHEGKIEQFVYGLYDIDYLESKKASENKTILDFKDNELIATNSLLDGIIEALSSYRQDVEDFYNESLSTLNSLSSQEEVENFNPIF